MIGKTAAYTICKNEHQFVEKWLYYTREFDYRVVLDTGSTDGTWEEFEKAAKDDKNLIIEQRTFTPWHFSVARNYNMTMVPKDVEWGLSPDLDEYFSINVLPEMEKTIAKIPQVTNISCDRLDVYSDVVRVGPPKTIGTNKIHRFTKYKWNQPIYEHLVWIGEGNELEIYNDDIYLIHDQDFKKKERSPLYLKMLREEYEVNPSNCWTLWFLVNHYFKEQDLDNFVKTACDFIRYSNQDEKYKEIRQVLIRFYQNDEVTPEYKTMIQDAMKSRR